MKVVPIISDSLGVRSMATLVETKDATVLIDASAALGPIRYGLPPLPQEYDALEKAKKEIREIAKKCDAFVISHYHYDHYDPDETFYHKKIVYAKDPKNAINQSQKKRGSDFAALTGNKCNLIYCDGNSFEHGKTSISFSEPFPHGPEGSNLGFVLATTIDDGFSLIHASDVQGPVSARVADHIIRAQPDLLIVDGPPTLFLGWKFSQKNLQDAITNLLRILKECSCEIILDHHLLRDLKYKERLAPVYESRRVKTFAEFLGKENSMLEAHRKELWKTIPNAEKELKAMRKKAQAE